MPKHLHLCAIIALFLFALWARAPQINRSLPFAYDEDELTHFQRVVRILQTGDFNPHFFYKPTLHFYLRVPVTANAFFKSVERGDLRRTKQLKALNEIGPQGFEPTFRHPLLLKYNRAWSIAISLLLIGITIALAREFAEPVSAFAAGLFLSTSPAHYVLSPFIGVDMLMSVFCMSCILACLRFLRNEKLPTLIAAAAFAGCAIGTKYNVFFILLIPPLSYVVCQFRRTTIERQVFVSLGLIALSMLCFLLSSPYILLDFRSFIDGAAYEVWHYKRTGDGTPGVVHLFHSIEWLASGGVGVFVFIFALVGLVLLVTERNSRSALLVLCTFPVLFLIYMSGQRLVVERNLLPVVPLLCVAAAVSIQSVSRWLSKIFQNQFNLSGLSVTMICYLLALAVRAIAP